MKKTWEWFDPLNPDKLFIVKTADVRIYQLDKNFTKSDLKKLLIDEDNTYTDRCLKRCKEQKYFTFKGFDDMLDFVKIKGYTPGFIRVVIEKNGEMMVAHGNHRWAAAYLFGVKEMQARLCRKI